MKLLVKYIKSLVIKYFKYYFRCILNPKMVSLNGVKIWMKSPVMSKNVRDFIYRGTYEFDEIKILKDIIKPEYKVLEIGAGIGYLSAFCAKIVGSKNVFAYEANPSMIPHIEKNYQINNVTPLLKNYVISDKNGTCDFYCEEAFWSSSTIKRSNSGKIVKVETKNINEILEAFKPDVLIMDIEGGEKDLIPFTDVENSNIKFIIIEVHPEVIGERNASHVINTLIKKGFILSFKYITSDVFLFKKAE